MAKATKLEGFKTDLPQAELDAFFAAPRPPNPALLGKATTRILYDVDRWRREGKPAYAATLARETHVSDPNCRDGLKFRSAFPTPTVLGARSRRRFRPKPGPRCRPGGAGVEPALGGQRLDDLSTTRANRSANTSPSSALPTTFEFGKQVGVSPILFYDPAERVVATLHPNHTYEKVVFDPVAADDL